MKETSVVCFHIIPLISGQKAHTVRAASTSQKDTIHIKKQPDKRDLHVRNVTYERDLYGVYLNNTIHIRPTGPHTTCREHIIGYSTINIRK